jgi:hypothetical protein
VHLTPARVVTSSCWIHQPFGPLGAHEDALASGIDTLLQRLTLDAEALTALYDYARVHGGVLVSADAITTSTFTAEAPNYLKKSPKAIRLVDGTELAALMIEFGVCVSRARTLVVPRVDEDFFDEGLT